MSSCSRNRSSGKSNDKEAEWLAELEKIPPHDSAVLPHLYAQADLELLFPKARVEEAERAEEEAEQSQERDDDGGEVEASLSSAIRGSTHTITLHRGAIALCWGAISVRLRGAITIISADSGARDSDSGEQGE